MTKTCKTCREDKTHDEFYDTRRPDGSVTGKRATCKACVSRGVNDRQKERRRNGLPVRHYREDVAKARGREIAARYYAKHRESILAKEKAKRQQLKQNKEQ